MSHIQLIVQLFDPAGAAVPQPVPIWQAAPCEQDCGGTGGGDVGGGGGGDVGGHDTVHWKCPVPSQKHEFVQPLGIPPPHPSLPLHGVPGVTQVVPGGTEEVPGGQVSLTHCPLMIA